MPEAASLSRPADIRHGRFAPVVTRFLTYRPDLASATLGYCDAVRRHPLVDEWYATVPGESDAWLVPACENPA